MVKRLTPEEKAARDLQRTLGKEAERVAKLVRRHAMREAEREAVRTAFEAGLTEKDKLALATILVPNGERLDTSNRVKVPTFENEFIESLFNQLKSRGCLSPAQLTHIVRAYDRKIEFEAQRVAWPAVAEGDDVMVLCTVTSIDQQRSRGYGLFWKIKLKSHYGRIFHINTTAQKFLSVAEAALKETMRVNVQGKAGWVSPDTRIVVLDKKGLYFQGL